LLTPNYSQDPERGPKEEEAVIENEVPEDGWVRFKPLLNATEIIPTARNKMRVLFQRIFALDSMKITARWPRSMTRLIFVGFTSCLDIHALT